MLSEAAIVATDVGGVREALGTTGLLVSPREPLALAEAIASLLRWPEGRERLGRQARDRALRWFTEQRFVDAYRGSYSRLLKQSVAPVRPKIDAAFEETNERAAAIA